MITRWATRLPLRSINFLAVKVISAKSTEIWKKVKQVYPSINISNHWSRAHKACKKCILNFFVRLSNLVELNLNNSSYGTTDQVLQEVTRSLKKLRKLQVAIAYSHDVINKSLIPKNCEASVWRWHGFES